MSDTDEPTVWEDLGPARTGSVLRLVPPCPSLDSLRPATEDDFRRELTACLALVAPAGMTEENRRDWLAVAWGTLKHMPPDLLRQGCAKARKSCDHPAKIVPTIIADTEEQLRRRREYGPPSSYAALPSPQMAPRVLSREELDTMPSDLREMGLKAGFLAYREDGKLIEANQINGGTLNGTT